METKHIQTLYKGNIATPLKSFCAVIEEGSIEKAAARISITKQAITKQIQSLERRLGGIELFDRLHNKKPMQPNAKGLRFYELAIQRINFMENLFRDFISNEANEENNVIKMAAHHSVIEKILPNHLYNFKEKNKGISYEIFNISRDRALKFVEEELIDLCIYPQTDYNKNIYWRTLFTSNPVLILPEGHKLERKKDTKIARNDLIENNFINIDKNMTFDYYAKNILNPSKKTSHIKLIDCDWNIAKELTKSRNGVTGVFDYFLDDGDKGLSKKDLSHILPKLNIDLVIRKNSFVRKNIRDFIEMIKEDYFNGFDYEPDNNYDEKE